MKSIDELGISPAPWQLDEGDEEVIAEVSDQHGEEVCEAPFYSASDLANNNLRLIAAATELYAVLRECEVFISSTNPHGRLIGTIRAALAKAGGAE